MKKRIAMFLVAMLFLNGCGVLQNTEKKPVEKTIQIGEALLPQDILFLAKFNTEDSKELQNYQTLKQILLPSAEDYQTQFTTEIQKKLTEYNLDFETDIKPLFGEKTETIFAIGGELTSDSPEIYIIQKLENLEKYTEIINKLLGQEILLTIENGYKTKENSENQSNPKLFLGEKNGFVVLTNRQANLSEVINLEIANSLIYSEKYIQVRENLPTTFLGLTYVNLELLALELQNMLLQTQDLDAKQLAQINNSWLEIVSGLGASVNAEPEGLKFLGHVQGNKKIMEKLDFAFNKIPNQKTYLNKILPGKGLYFYTEMFDLKQKIEEFEKSLQENTPENYEIYQKQKEEIKKTIGFDLDKDVFTWLDKSMALTIQDTTGIIPGITFAVDVSSNPDGAGKLLNTLDSFLAIAMLSLQEYTTAIERQDVEIGDNTFEKISIATENLPLEVQEEAELIVPILDELQIVYGITKNNLLIFSTYPQIAEDFDKDVIAENTTYKMLAKEIEQKGQGIFYFSPNIFSAHLEKIKDTMQEFESISTNEAQNLEKVISYLKSFSGFIFTNIAHEESSEGQGYLKINQ